MKNRKYYGGKKFQKSLSEPALLIGSSEKSKPKMIVQNSEQSYVFLITIEKVHKHHFSKNSALEIDHQRYSVNNNYWLVEQGSFLFSFFSYCQQLNDSFRIFFAVAFPILIFVVFFT